MVCRWLRLENESSMKLDLSEDVSKQSLLHTQVWGGVCLDVLLSFRDFLELLSCLLPMSNEPPFKHPES